MVSIRKIWFIGAVVIFIGLLGCGDPNSLKRPKLAKEDSDCAQETLGKMRTIATALGAYGTDNAAYPIITGIDNLQPLVSPTYIRTLPSEDGWGNKFLLVSTESDYFLISAGADGSISRRYSISNTVHQRETTTDNFDADLILVNGAFVQFPYVE